MIVIDWLFACLLLAPYPQKLEFDENGLPVAQAPPRSRPGIPLNQDARDAKSGKGRKRLFLHPIIRQRDRCGTCPVRAGLVGGLCCAGGAQRCLLDRLPACPADCRLAPSSVALQACLNLGWKKACMTRRAEQEGTGV